MIKSALDLFFLRDLSWSSFNFPRWQAILGLVITGIITGLQPSIRELFQEIVGMPAILWSIAVAYSVFLILICTPVIVGFLMWFMKLGGRWNGQGNMFNLFSTSWLIANLLSAGLMVAGTPMIFLLPLWLYSIWVCGNALSAAIPKASLSYSLGGIVITMILAMIVTSLVMALGSFALMVVGAISPQLQ